MLVFATIRLLFFGLLIFFPIQIYYKTHIFLLLLFENLYHWPGLMSHCQSFHRQLSSGNKDDSNGLTGKKRQVCIKKNHTIQITYNNKL